MHADDNPAPCDQDAFFRLIVDCLRVVKPAAVDGFAPVTPDSRLSADLSLQSIEFVRLASAIQNGLGGAPLPFQNLFVTPQGNLVDDVKVRNIIDFLCGVLEGGAKG